MFLIILFTDSFSRYQRFVLSTPESRGGRYLARLQADSGISVERNAYAEEPNFLWHRPWGAQRQAPRFSAQARSMISLGCCGFFRVVMPQYRCVGFGFILNAHGLPIWTSAPLLSALVFALSQWTSWWHDQRWRVGCL